MIPETDQGSYPRFFALLFLWVLSALCDVACCYQHAVGQESTGWTAFAQVDVVEGKKPKPDKHKHDEVEPTPAPAPDPDADPEPIPQKPDHKPHVVKPDRPHNPVAPDEAKPEGGSHNHGDKTITNIVYRSSWTPSPWDLMALTGVALSLLISIVTARRAGLGLSTLWMFWK